MNTKNDVIITKDYYQYCKINEYNFNDYPEILKNIKDEDPIIQFKGLMGIKKLCQEAKKAPDSKNCYLEILPNLLEFIKNYPEEFQNEALNCLLIMEKINIFLKNTYIELSHNDNKDLIKTMVSFIENHKNVNFNIFIPALKYLAIISSNDNNSKILLNYKVKDKILDILKYYQNDLYIIKKCIKSLQKICQNKSVNQSYIDNSEDVIEILSNIFSNYPDDIKINMCSLKLIITLTLHKNSNILDKLIELNLLQKIIEFANTENNDYIIYSLRIIGNFAMNEDSKFTEKLLENNIIDLLKKFLDKNYNINIRKEASFTLSNIAAGTTTQIIKLYKSDIYPILSDIIINESESECKINCLWTLYNFTCIPHKELLDEMIQKGLMKIIVDRFDIDKGNTLACSLEALEKLLKSKQNVNDPAAIDIAENEIINLNLFDALKSLKKKNNEEIVQRKIDILLRDYFGIADANSL